MENNQSVNSPSQPNPAPQHNTSSNTGMAILCYLGILIIIPFVTEAHKDAFVKFHIKQGLALIILEIASIIIAVIPILGWILSPLMSLAALVLLIIGIINAATGKTKELPLIGKIGRSFNF